MHIPIQTNTGQYVQYIHVYNTYKYIQIPTNTDLYHTYRYIPIQTIHANTHWYISIQANTYQYIQYVQYMQKQIKTCQYLHISNVSTCQYITILAINNKNNIYQYIPSQYIPIHSTIQTAIHTNTLHEVQYLPIHTHNLTDVTCSNLYYQKVNCRYAVKGDRHIHIYRTKIQGGLKGSCVCFAHHIHPWEYACG